MRRRSITEQLKRTRSLEERLELCHKWAHGWENDYIALSKELKRAIASGDHIALVNALGDLRGLTEPKFRALHNVFNELVSPSRELGDD